jgi:uncharacterized protein YneF (UPF0154 family)
MWVLIIAILILLIFLYFGIWIAMASMDGRKLTWKNFWNDHFGKEK